MAKLSFNSKNFAKQLEKDLKEALEKDAKKHPESFLDDHVGDVVDLLRRSQDLRALSHILLVGETAGQARVILHIYLMTGPDEGIDAGGGQTHAMLLSLDLLGTTDTHKDAPFQNFIGLLPSI